jgi:protein-L-isoaspartate(D-aspartate) O-methyltransferase
MRDLATVRADYAERVLTRAGLENDRLRAALAAVPREKFLGPGPWLMTGAGAYRRTETDDPAEVYSDALFALEPIHAINNGEPSAHAKWIDALDLKAGERVGHIGAGTGYYSAILAELVGAEGAVEAFEIYPDLAARARVALADRPNVRVHAVSGTAGKLPPVDAIYVNAGATAPSSVWLDALEEGGRLVFPLTGVRGSGGMLKLTRSGHGRWPARMISSAYFIDLVGARSPAQAQRVDEAFRRGGAAEVAGFLRDRLESDRDWLRGEGWRLTR